jgi:hypothetical protein
MFKNIKIVRSKNFKPTIPTMTADEQERIVSIKRGTLSAIVTVALIIMFWILIPFIYSHSLDGITEYMFPHSNERGGYLPTEILTVAAIVIFIHLFSILVNTAIHEWLHIAALPKAAKAEKIYITYKLPFYLGIWTFAWIKRIPQIVGLLCPVTIIGAVSLFGAVALENPILEFFFLIWAWNNFSGSVSDVINALYLIIKVPKNSLIFNNYILLPTPPLH